MESLAPLLVAGLRLSLDAFVPPGLAPGVVVLAVLGLPFQWFQVQQISTCGLCLSFYCFH